MTIVPPGQLGKQLQEVEIPEDMTALFDGFILKSVQCVDCGQPVLSTDTYSTLCTKCVNEI